MKKKFYSVAMRNVKNEYVLGRITGMLDIKANIDRGQIVKQLGEDCYTYTVKSKEKTLGKTLNEINKFYPFVVFNVTDLKKEES